MDWNGGTGWNGPYERVGTTAFVDYAHSLPYAVNLKGNASEYASIARSVDLNGKTYVILNFWWKTWSLEAGEYVTVEVYDILGRRLRRLVDADMKAGQHSIRFDGRDSEGRELSAGVYLYRMAAGDFVQTRKMVFLK